MLIDFTERAVTPLPHEMPRSLVLRIADHPDHEGFIAVSLDYETPYLSPVEEETFYPFCVYELSVGRKHLDGDQTPFWVYSARTDGEDFDRCHFLINLTHEGHNGWWVEIQRNPIGVGYTPVEEAVFRLPLLDFDPDFSPALEVIEREADWAKLASDD
jgi:hypothetical protein